MLKLIFILFVALPLGGGLVIGAILFFERLAARVRAPAAAQPPAPAPAPQQGLVARISQPALQRAAAAWAAHTSGSHPRVAAHQ
jgi:hypothetical protein